MRNTTVSVVCLLALLVGSGSVMAKREALTDEFSITRLSKTTVEPGEEIYIYGTLGAQKQDRGPGAARYSKKVVYLRQSNRLLVSMKTSKWRDSRCRVRIPYTYRPGTYQVRIQTTAVDPCLVSNTLTLVLTKADKPDLAICHDFSYAWKKDTAGTMGVRGRRLGVVDYYRRKICLEEADIIYRRDGRYRVPASVHVVELNGVDVPSFDVTWRGGARTITRKHLSIKAFETKAFGVTLGIGPKPLSLVTTLNSSKKVVEHNNTENNCMYTMVNFDIPEKPELVFTRLRMLPALPANLAKTATYKPGSRVTVEASVKNVGTLAAKAFKVGFRWGDPARPSDGHAPVRSLAPGKSVNVTNTYVYRKAGRYTVHADVDSTGAIDEFTETNNTVRIFLNVRR